MYVRINQVKFPNKMAKEAVQKHAKSTLSNFGVNGRIARLTVNISEISHSVVSIWKDKETFKKYGVEEINKFIKIFLFFENFLKKIIYLVFKNNEINIELKKEIINIFVI